MLINFFCQLDTNWSHLGRGNLSWEITSIRFSCRSIFFKRYLINDWYKRTQPIVCSTIPRQVDLDRLRTRKVAVQAGRGPSEQCSSVVSLQVPIWRFCLDFPLSDEPFSRQSGWSAWCSSQQGRNKVGPQKRFDAPKKSCDCQQSSQTATVLATGSNSNSWRQVEEMAALQSQALSYIKTGTQCGDNHGCNSSSVNFLHGLEALEEC